MGHGFGEGLCGREDFLMHDLSGLVALVRGEIARSLGDGLPIRSHCEQGEADQLQEQLMGEVVFSVSLDA